LLPLTPGLAFYRSSHSINNAFRPPPHFFLSLSLLRHSSSTVCRRSRGQSPSFLPGNISSRRRSLLPQVLSSLHISPSFISLSSYQICLFFCATMILLISSSHLPNLSLVPDLFFPFSVFFKSCNNGDSSVFIPRILICYLYFFNAPLVFK